MTRRHLLGCAILAGLAFQMPAHAQFFIPLQWSTCAPDTVDGDWPSLGARLQCATMQAPLDHAVPDGPRTEVALVRLVASDDARREGAIFFNFGGPGGNPRTLLPPVAAAWVATDANDPVQGERKSLTERFDLIAVVPRGLKGSMPYDCLSGSVTTPFKPILWDQSDANRQAMLSAAKEQARMCDANPFVRYMDTGQHVGDMEMARRLLGLDKLNFVGESYGTWVGTWYAAVHPERVGRMLLDSTMDITQTLAEGETHQAIERHRIFVRDAVTPALADPARYALGTDEFTVLDRMRAMPKRAREVWATTMTSPAELTAALAMSDWLHTDPDMTEYQLTQKAFNHRFSPDVATNFTVAAKARELIDRYYHPKEDDFFSAVGTEGFTTNLVVRCSDTPWNASPAFWFDRALDNAHDYPGGSEDEAMTGLICSQWKGARSTRPSMARLAEAPPILMLQAESDPSTPMFGATRVLSAYRNMHMVVARGMTGHAIFGKSLTPCIETTASHYLLTGEMPTARYAECDFVPLPEERSDAAGQGTRSRRDLGHLPYLRR